MLVARASFPGPRTPREIVKAMFASREMICETYRKPEEFEFAGWSATAAREYHERRIRMLRQYLHR